MSGSSESNEDLVAGRVNRANDQTTIWAENRYSSVDVVFIEVGEFRIPFTSNVIFKVEAAKDSEDSGEFRPPSPLDAIVGVGWSAEHNGLSGGIGVTGLGGAVGGLGVRGEGGENATGVLGDAGGRAAGVVGLGGPREGSGVFGLGSGGERFGRRGRGGTGVHGAGGLADLSPAGGSGGGAPPPEVLPGTGVLGQGGTITDQNKERRLLGTGVIGVGGDAGNDDRPSPSNAGSAGVFGQGAEARIDQVFEGGASTLVGPAEAGAGVIGRGGLPVPREFPVGAGVIGLAGGHDKPAIDETGGCGVYGLGTIGVRARGDGGPGVHARSDADRGGVFATERAAQVRLVPQRVRTRLPETTAVTPTGIAPAALASGVVSLPKAGEAGDLMTLSDDLGQCTLWFCVRDGSGGGPARWAQVLLGQAFDGQS